MKLRRRFGWRLALALAAAGPAQAARPADEPLPSAHRPGPHGLEGWTVDSPVRDSGYGDQRFAFRLVIARRGHVVRRILGEPILWRWIFWADGRQIAYETGPFHFGATCVLIRLSDGRRLDAYDCYNDRPPVRPDRVRALGPMG